MNKDAPLCPVCRKPMVKKLSADEWTCYACKTCEWIRYGRGPTMESK